ncbi:hypothetical protein [Legionella saoudiensis]|uniref:hypothetical protein n=1 Tax=Legionella saoudiensis TaxID=1750561 RepID=UPI00072FAC3A|nr:hypothetical protein [Legionella saoudiensis]
MPKKLSIDEYFQLIKENHRKNLEKNMVTHLEMAGNLEQAKLVKRYVELIGGYRESQSFYLDYAVEQPTTTAKVGHGVLAGLLGIGVAGVAYYAQKASSPADIINPLPGINNIVGGVFSAALGAGAGYLAYQAWLASTGRAADDDARKEFDAEMKKAGFTDKKYEELSRELAKLFHYRECLLLGLENDVRKNIRQDFEDTYLPQGQRLDKDALNAAIEVYFLDELNKLFNQAFVDIYDIQDQKIQDEKQEYKIISWLKNYFAKPEEREKFTQQLQLEFMNQCLRYLTAQMVEPSFMAKHPYITASIGGLIAGSIALGLSSLIIGGPISAGIIGIGLVITCLAAVGTYFAVNNIDSLRFKRDKDNRDSLQHARENIIQESSRLKRLIKEVVPTTDKDLQQLEAYSAQHVPGGFAAYFDIFNSGRQQVAMGASTAWIREYAIRYRHSKQVEINLSEHHKGIITNGEQQTKEMQELLLEEMRLRERGELPVKLKNFIDHTHAYLKNPENKEFIKRFGLVEKIKQQVIEIVAAVPQGTRQTTLPKELVDFYILPVAAGGLGGLIHDLEQARSLAPVVAPEAAVDELHPYYQMLVTAQRFNYALTQDPNKEFILIGDSDYRAMLGLRIDSPSVHIESKINTANVQSYLNHSLDFLYSLNKPVQIDDSTNLDTPFINTKEFVLYRTLLIKQLAHLADPSNPRVNNEVRREIERFAREKLHIEPKIVFDDVMHQGLFIQKDVDSPHLKYLGRERSVSDLEYIADAVRLDLAYASKPLTPRMMIAQEAVDFLFDKGEKTIFSYGKSAEELPPETTAEYVTKIQVTITTTKAFMISLAERNTLKKTGALASYIHDCIREIQGLRLQIAELDREVPVKTAVGPFKSKELEQADLLLTEYEANLEEVLAANKVEQLNMLGSLFQFGGFKVPSIDLSFNDWEKLEERDLMGSSWLLLDSVPPIPVEQEKIILHESDTPLIQITATTKLEELDLVQDDGKRRGEESIIIISDNTEISLEKITHFINALEEYLSALDKEAEISFFNYRDYSKGARKMAATQLQSALQELKDSGHPNTSFLNNGVYTHDVKLKQLISTNLETMELTHLSELFSDKRALAPI